MLDATTAPDGVYSRSHATHVIFSGLQENACWSITKEHPKKTKSVEKDNVLQRLANNFRTPEY
jgi:hypothetical protein